MGKVGSKSVFHTLKPLVNEPIVHCHYIMNNIGNYNKATADNILSYNGKIKIITLIRDPITRNISAYYHNMKNMINKNDPCTIDYISNTFYKKYNHDCPLLWLNIELYKLTGIDVYDYPFDKEKGYQHYENDKYQILLITLENLNKCWTEILKFANIDTNNRLIKQNAGNSRIHYGIPYNTVKNHIISNMSNEYVNKMKNSKYYQHFYKKNE